MWLAVEEIAASFPGIELVGCTSSGEMSSDMGFIQDSICLMLFVSYSQAFAAGGLKRFFRRFMKSLALAIFDESDRFYLRVAIDFDENNGSVDYATRIREDRKVQLTEATPRNITNDLQNNLHNLMKDIGNDWTPNVACLFSCVSRRWIMGLRTSEELTLATSILPASISVAGFYTFGEIVSLAEKTPPKLHNCALVAKKLARAHESQARLELGF